LDRFRGLPRVLATLLGPPLQPLPTSQRGTQGELTRTYQAGAVTVSITVVPGEEAGGLAIEGLVGVGQATAGADRIALLIGPTGESHAVAVDELGNFALTGVSPGTYRLEVGLGDSIIVLEDLNIAPRG
jgi:hypothetical protein